jgi:outer membrane protein OmpA-like peptidoglycan-associated protein
MAARGAMPARESASEELAELRGLLLAPEQEEIRRLKRRLEAARSAEEISLALPLAVHYAAQRNRKLRSELLPVIEQSMRLSVRRDPSILSEALFPIVSEAVKKAVAHALRQLGETLQESMEQSLTARSVGWRLQALRTGRSYGEIVLIHSRLYCVEQVYLIHRETGLLLTQISGSTVASQDAQMVSAMLIAIQDFVKDSLGGQASNAIETIEAGEFVIWLQQGSHAILAGIIRGSPPKGLRAVFERVLQSIGATRDDALRKFEGDTAPFEACQEDLRHCFLGAGHEAARRIPWWPVWTVAAFVLALFGSLVLLSMRDARHWQSFVSSLRTEPGIVVTEAHRSGGEYFITGLRDPLARDPSVLAKTAGFVADRTHFRWQSYLSLEAPFAQVREFQEAAQRVDRRRLYFRNDDSKIAAEQLAGISDAAADIKFLLSAASRAGKRVQIEVAGKTDASGTERRNSALSKERSSSVAAMLTALGIPAQVLSMADAQSQQTPDPSLNRCVSFHVRTIAQ